MTNTVYIHGHASEVATKEELLDFANGIRRAGGANPIPDLLPADHQPNSCLIARALNFNSHVSHLDSWSIQLGLSRIETRSADSGDQLWAMRIESGHVARKIKDQLGLIVLNLNERLDYWIVVLPEHIGNAAAAFDAGAAFSEYERL